MFLWASALVAKRHFVVAAPQSSGPALGDEDGLKEIKCRRHCRVLHIVGTAKFGLRLPKKESASRVKRRSLLDMAGIRPSVAVATNGLPGPLAAKHNRPMPKLGGVNADYCRLEH